MQSHYRSTPFCHLGSRCLQLVVVTMRNTFPTASAPTIFRRTLPHFRVCVHKKSRSVFADDPPTARRGGRAKNSCGCCGWRLSRSYRVLGPSHLPSAQLPCLATQPSSLCHCKVDEGWILIPSPPVTSLQPPNGSDSDCLTQNTYLLVPVADAARLGSILAAGLHGAQMIRVSSGGPADRSMRQFCVGPLRVLRSGNWILEQASTIRSGDLVNTLHGLEAVESVGDIRESYEEVFSLDVCDGGEVYVCTPTWRDNGQWSWAGVAALESARKRTRSAPPHGRWTSPVEGLPLPSAGSWDCKAKRGERCTNICTKFMRDKCLEGSDCRFCHFPHPGEPKRLPRGPRDGRSSQSA